MKTLKKRKRQGKTSYKKRLELLKSGFSRVVIRKTNKYINIQFISSNEAKDNIIIGISSRDLLKYGWPKEKEGSLKSILASYLTGYLAGKKMLNKENNKFILDIGLQRNVHGGRIYSALKGIIDAGVHIAHSKDVFPSDERIKGKHLKHQFEKEFQSIIGILEKIPKQPLEKVAKQELKIKPNKN